MLFNEPIYKKKSRRYESFFVADVPFVKRNELTEISIQHSDKAESLWRRMVGISLPLNENGCGIVEFEEME